ncbi:MAG: hypothetical protein WAM74_09225, partial [Xanthobacteraceae bacterium]
MPLNLGHDNQFSQLVEVVEPSRYRTELILSSRNKLIFCVILYREDSLPIDRFAVYEVPIPDTFQATRGRRVIKIALAFDPPVRHTRFDYAGVTMSFSLIRGTPAEDVLKHFRRWQKSEGPAFRVNDRFKCPMVPGPQRRERGTLQCATFTAERNIAG